MCMVAMMQSIVLLLVGFVLLIKGADFFVEGSSSVARALRIPSMIVGLTIVAMGTSLPELAVSVTASVAGNNALAVSNVIGSNLFNLMLVCGACALFAPLIVQKDTLKKEIPVSVLCAVLLFVLGISGMEIGRTDGVILLLLFIGFLVWMVRSALKAHAASAEAEDPSGEYKIYPAWKCALYIVGGYIAQGEYGWNPTARTVEAFKAAHAQREFGFHPNDNHMAFLDELEQEAFFFDDALVNSGRRNPAWGTTDFTLISLPDPDAPGAWSRTYQQKIAQAKVEQKRYEKICQGIKEAKQHALRNRYTLEVYEQTNHLFNFPVRLILALHNYDITIHEQDKQTALQQINEVCNDFQTMRKQLEETYSQTRFMEQPDGYIADQNHHNHLAAKTNNSDWWYYYEIPMIRKTRTWMNSQTARQKNIP